MLRQTILGIAAVLAISAAYAGDAPAQYATSCTFCHSNGAAGAPMTGDSKAWAARLEKGMDVLVKGARDGVGAMPPTGMCGNCSDEDFTALIQYMAGDAAGSKE